MRQHTMRGAVCCLRSTFAAAVAAALLFPAGALAGPVVYEQTVNYAAPDAGAFSQNSQELAAEFALSAAAQVSGASWFGTMFSPDPLNTGDTWSFSVRFFSDSANVPGSLLQTSSILASVFDTGLNIGGNRLYRFDASFAALTLNAGTSYWFSTINTGTQNTFRWTEAVSGMDSALKTTGGWMPWTETSRTPLNFSLTGTDATSVPDVTSTLSLLGVSLVAISSIRRYRL